MTVQQKPSAGKRTTLYDEMKKLDPDLLSKIRTVLRHTPKHEIKAATGVLSELLTTAQKVGLSRAKRA